MINIKHVKILLLFILLMFSFSFCCFAAHNDLFESQVEASGANDLFEYLNDDQIEMLSDLGIDNVTPEDLFSASPRKIFDLFYQVLTGAYSTPLNSSVSVIFIIVAVCMVSQFISSSGKLSGAISIFSMLCVSLCIIAPLSSCLARVISAIDMTADFMLALIPVLATVLTVSGNPTAALSYNSLCFAAAQVTAQLSSKFIRPVIQTSLSLSVMTGVCDTVNFEKLVSFVKRTVIFFMSLISTVFVTMLSLKGMLSASADTVAVRGVRFLIGNLIPVVGGAVSDAYMSISGTLTLVKNTAGIFGIAAIGVINLPVVAECLCWILAINVMAMISDMFSQEKISTLLKSISSVVTLLTVSLVFVVVVFVLSVGLIMLMKGG